jgi:hypothetical protein
MVSKITNITISKDLARNIVDSMRWMITDLNHRRIETGLNNGPSDEMKKAATAYATLKILMEDK